MTLPLSHLPCSSCLRLQAAAWAQEHAHHLSSLTAEQVQAQQAAAAAAQQAEEEAAAAAAAEAEAEAERMAQQERQKQAGAAFAAVVQQASAASRRPKHGPVLPPLPLQKLVQRWQRAANTSVAAAGEWTARQRQEAAARAQLRQQWEAVRDRLPTERQQAKTGRQAGRKAGQ